jgi:uncharacterized protein (TIGR02646 family)
MRRIDRGAVVAPAALANYHHATCSWDGEAGKTKFGGNDKKALRAALESMQDDCCAYCECATYGGGHIEHFRRKNQAHFPELTFAWENLFLSCDEEEHCGHYKDRGGSPYDPRELVKPDEDEPDDYFYFHSSGEVRVRSGIDASQVRRATETIRVFHLDSGTLQAARRRAVQAYERRDPGMLEALCDFEEALRVSFIQQEVQATARDPHGSVIRHLFEKVR